LLTAVVQAATDVEIRPASGASVRGQLVEISGDAVVIKDNAGTRRLPLTELWEITTSAQPPRDARAPSVWIDMADGSQVYAAQFTVTSGQVAIQLLTGQKLTMPTLAVRSVRFRDHAAAPKLAQQWTEITSARITADAIIVRRAESLDHLEGIIRDVTDENVQFEFEGKTIAAKRSKVDGILYYHPMAGDLPNRLAQVVDVSGSRWSAKSVQAAPDRFDLTTVSGVNVSLGVDQVTKIDFSSGNTVWLDDLEPESFQWRPYVASKLPNDLLSKLFDPRSPGGRGNATLVLGGQNFEKGLSLNSRMELVYRLTEDFRRCQALVGIDDRVREGGNVRLVISGDDKELFSQAITGHDEPFPLDLDITGVKRLKIVVDFGDELDIADHLNLCEARLTK
jgi:hypothetical protein